MGSLFTLSLVAAGVVLVSASDEVTSSSNATDEHSFDPREKILPRWHVFWCLLCLALNSMTFPSMLDREMDPSHALFLAFSSPIVALMDATDVFIDLSTQLIFGATFRDAARKTLWRRARLRYGKDIKVITPTYLEQSTALRLATAFILLSQGLQTFAYDNLLWAKMIAIMYLSSYFTLLALSYFAPGDWRSTPPLKQAKPRDKASFWIHFADITSEGVYLVTAGFQLVLYFFLFDKMIRSTVETYVPIDTRTPLNKGERPQHRVNSTFLILFAAFIDLVVALYFWCVMMLIPLCLCGFSTLLMVRSFRAIRAKEAGVAICHIGMLALFVPPMAFCTYEMFHIHFSLEDFEDVSDVALVIAAVYTCMGIAYVAAVGGVIKVVQIICDGTRSLEAYRPEGPYGVLLLLFASANFGMLFWFFIYGYDFAP